MDKSQESAQTMQRKTFLSFIKQADIFGYPVSLTYRNEPKFKSELGGITTILAIMGLIAYFGNLLDGMTRKETYQINTVL